MEEGSTKSILVEWTGPRSLSIKIERIEILRGPGSVLYGDNAVGGVINIITKRPEKPFSVEAGLAGGSYRYNKETGSVSGNGAPIQPSSMPGTMRLRGIVTMDSFEPKMWAEKSFTT